MVLRFPLGRRHAVNAFAGLVPCHLDPALGSGFAPPVTQAVAAEIGQQHEVDVLNFLVGIQMRDQAAEGGGVQRRALGFGDVFRQGHGVGAPAFLSGMGSMRRGVLAKRNAAAYVAAKQTEPCGVSTPLKLAIWDVDGTIVDSRQVIQKAMDRAFRRAGLGGIDYDRTRTIVGLELTEAVTRLAPPDFGPERAVQLAGFYKEAFVEQRAEAGFEEPLYEGVRDTLERLVEQGWLMGVATGKARRGLDIVFEHHDLHRYFDTLQTVDGGAGKPNPRMVLDALRETGTEAAHAVMIGDTGFDMAMGRNAGVHTLGVSWGFHTADEIAGAGAHSIHDDFDALDRALDSFAESVGTAATPGEKA